MRSVRNQTVRSDVILCTSTPNGHISGLCGEYGIPMYVNDGEGGIAQDWNYAYRMANAEYVTITHQDDVYDKHYAERAIRLLDREKAPLIYFTDYSELREGEVVRRNTLLVVKRIMLLPLRLRFLWGSRFVRRRILSLGSPICCPSVTYVKKNCPDVVFKSGFRSNVDWEAWEMLSKKKGTFVYDTRALMFHRIHGESETSNVLNDNERTKEDYIMYCKFWPPAIAKILAGVYSISQNSNSI